jgi:DNA-binding transcriptional regulator/RsmH inhibitor MraZ
MIKNKVKLEKFYRELDERERLSYEQALAIYNALYKEAVHIGAISHENIWDGFDVDLRITKAMNRLSRGRKTNKKNSSKAGQR